MKMVEPNCNIFQILAGFYIRLFVLIFVGFNLYLAKQTI